MTTWSVCIGHHRRDMTSFSFNTPQNNTGDFQIIISAFHNVFGLASWFVKAFSYTISVCVFQSQTSKVTTNVTGPLLNGNWKLLGELENGTRQNPGPGYQSLYVKYEEIVLLWKHRDITFAIGMLRESMPAVSQIKPMWLGYHLQVGEKQ